MQVTSGSQKGTMMKRPARLSLAVVLTAMLIAFTGCYLMPGSGNGKAKVSIGVKGLPPNLASVVLVVTAPGMAPITTTASINAGSITVSVPAGPARTFTLLLNSASATLQGSATVDLQAGQTTSINLTPTLGATQIVIPDNLNNRIVQISDMNGSGWVAKIGDDFGLAGQLLQPYAVDFDSTGRIYIANGSGAGGGLFRINDINHTNPFDLVDSTTGITMVAVDRKNGRVYYSIGDINLPWKSTDLLNSGSFVLTQDEPATTGMAAIAADDQGMLYIVDYESTSYKILKYNPSLSSGRVVAASGPGLSLVTPRGIMVKGPYVYVCDIGSLSVSRLDKNLQYIDSFQGPPTDPFVGPTAFLAVLDKSITVMDDVFLTKRLASFDNITGSGWLTFGSVGTGQGQFKFFNGG